MKILIAGDYCPQHRVAELFEKEEYDTVLGDVKSIINDSDYSIVNLECPVTIGNEKKIIKCGPNLHCDKKGLDALKWVGFNCVTLANNHFLDYGKDGVVNTLSILNAKQIDYVGGGLNEKKASETLFKKIGRETLAVINCCEQEFSIATKVSAGSNAFNPINQYNHIKQAKEKSDYVILIYHGGHEFFQLPSLKMKEAFHFFIDCGVDLIVCHHQHCYSGFEVYNSKPIFYGIGNFCFDKDKKNKNCLWNYGYMIQVDSSKKEDNFSIIPYKQCLNEPIVEIIDFSFIEKELNIFNSIICDDAKLEMKLNEYYKGRLLDSNLMLEPVSNRYIRALQRRHLLPLFKYNRRHILRLLNFLICESQWEVIKYFLFSEYNKLR